MSGALKKILALLYGTALLIPLGVSAQMLKFDFDEYGVPQGLSHNQVFSIAQDTAGFMWFGTSDGLNRFDGYNFKKFKYIEKDTNSIISNDIRSLLAANDGSLWIGTNNGVCRYLPNRELIQRYEINYTNDTKLHGNYVSSIRKNPDGSIWIAYLGSGVDIIRPETDYVLHFTMYRDDNYILRNDMITSLEFMPDGYVLLGGREGLQVISNSKQVLKEEEIVKKFPWKKSIPSSYTYLHLSKDKNTLWVATESNGLYKVDLNNNSVQNYNTSNSALQSNTINCIYEDSKNNIWIGSDAIYIIEKESGQIEWYNKKGMYIKNTTYSVFEDRGGNLWMGTTRLGVRKINHEESEVMHFHSNQGEGSIKSDEVLCFSEDDTGNLWLGAGGVGLYKVNSVKSSYSFTECEINSKLTSRSIKQIYKDKSGCFWMGTWGGGFVKYHPIKKTLKQFNINSGNFSTKSVWSITDDEDGDLWLGTLKDGVCHFSPDTEEFEYFKHDDNDTTSLVNSDVVSIFRDSRNIIWIGTGNGLSILLPKAKAFKNYFQVTGKIPKKFPSNVILSIYEDRSGNIWLGTKGSGVLIVNFQDNEVKVNKVISEVDGLPSNIVNSIQEDNSGNIWLATNNGLSKINVKDKSVIELNASMALRGVEFLYRSNFKTKTGHLLFGSTSGFYSINPENNNINTIAPPVYLSELRLLNHAVTVNDEDAILKEPLGIAKEISIPSNYNYYTFEYVALNYNLTEKNQYAYKLEGFDKDWNYVGSQRFANYTNLDPGTYTFRVKASNNDNIWNEKGASIKIIILPPWWKTWAFKIFMVVFSVLSVIAIFQFRVREINAINARLEKQVADRTAELSKINMELFQSKEEISTQNEELLETQEEISAQRDLVASQNKEIKTKNQQLENTSKDLQNQNQLLEKLHREKDGMINIIVHDLKSPLKQISGLVDLVAMSGKTNDDQNKYISLVNKVVNNSSNMINNLLELHGIETSATKPVIESILLADFLPVWLENHNSLLNHKSQKARVNIKTPIEPIKVSREYLSRILDNLLTNAMKFSEMGKSIYISACQEGENIFISVKDEGPGISEVDKKNLFVPFKKLTARPTAGEPSSGLGLSIVKLLIEKIGGTIQVKSELHKGTEFIITLSL